MSTFTLRHDAPEFLPSQDLLTLDPDLNLSLLDDTPMVVNLVDDMINFHMTLQEEDWNGNLSGNLSPPTDFYCGLVAPDTEDRSPVTEPPLSYRPALQVPGFTVTSTGIHTTSSWFDCHENWSPVWSLTFSPEEDRVTGLDLMDALDLDHEYCELSGQGLTPEELNEVKSLIKSYAPDPRDWDIDFSQEAIERNIKWAYKTVLKSRYRSKILQ